MVQVRGTARVLAIQLLAIAALPIAASAAPGPSIRRVVDIVSGPAPLDPFRRPQGLFTDPLRGISMVADTGNHRVAVFDSTWRCRGVLAFPDGEPRAMAADGRGRLFVVDALNPALHVLTAWGEPIRDFPPPVPAGVGRAQPQDLVIGASGRMYLLVGGDHPGLLILDARGERLRAAGFGAADDVNLQGPVSLDVNAAETRVAVIDPMAEASVRLFDAELGPVASFGKHGDGEGTFSMATDVRWGPDETLWITDSLRHSISVFDGSGRYLGRIGGFGDGPGQFNYPSGCAFVAPDRLLVLERAGARFQVLEVALPAAAHAEAALGHTNSVTDGVLSASEQGR